MIEKLGIRFIIAKNYFVSIKIKLKGHLYIYYTLTFTKIAFKISTKIWYYDNIDNFMESYTETANFISGKDNTHTM